MAARKRADPGDGERENSEDAEPAAVTAAAHELYRAEPDRFAALRKELAAAAREHGEPEAAKVIAKLRKPTTAAWIVNRQVQEDETVIPRLLDLNDRLRDAHENLDPDALRSLSAERRELVDELTRQALHAAQRRDAAAQLRDEVRSTFDAAVADPSITVQLGRLQGSQRWSGFGVAPATGPALTVVQGGKDRRPAAPRKQAAPRHQESTIRTRQPAQRPAKPSTALAAARKALSEAESLAESAAREERACAERVDSLSTRLAELEDELGSARTALEKARKDAKSARTRHRDAQRALTRAERASAP